MCLLFSANEDLKALVNKLESRVLQLEKGSASSKPAPPAITSPTAKPVMLRTHDEDDDDDAFTCQTPSSDAEKVQI